MQIINKKEFIKNNFYYLELEVKEKGIIHFVRRSEKDSWNLQPNLKHFTEYELNFLQMEVKNYETNL